MLYIMYILILYCRVSFYCVVNAFCAIFSHIWSSIKFCELCILIY